MGMTLLCVAEDGTDGLRLFVSNEYSVQKDRDATGAVLPDQEWQHPDPLTLRYTAFGGFDCPQSFLSFLESWLQLGIGQFGGHVRLISDGAAAIARGREQSWQEKADQDQLYLKEMEAEREQEQLLKDEQRRPIYEWCQRCNAQREACKNHAHRGNRCMHCCGGVGDSGRRYCFNCLDLPYREKRERGLGDAIVYTGESDNEE